MLLGGLKAMLHRTIRNDDFERNRALQCWNSVVTIPNNVATMLQRSVALKIVVANRLVKHHLKQHRRHRERQKSDRFRLAK